MDNAYSSFLIGYKNDYSCVSLKLLFVVIDWNFNEEHHLELNTTPAIESDDIETKHRFALDTVMTFQTLTERKIKRYLGLSKKDESVGFVTSSRYDDGSLVIDTHMMVDLRNLSIQIPRLYFISEQMQVNKNIIEFNKIPFLQRISYSNYWELPKKPKEYRIGKIIKRKVQ